jgi:hypothetical protein
MGSRFRTFRLDSGHEGEELNRFLSGPRTIVKVDRVFEAGAWHFCVEYLGEKPIAGAPVAPKDRVDYKEVLSAPNFRLYARLRDWRKAIADEKGLDLANIFTNAHLAGFAEGRPKTLADVGKVEGVGKKRVETYGDTVLRIVREYEEETGTDGTDRRPGQPDPGVPESGVGKEPPVGGGPLPGPAGGGNR